MLMACVPRLDEKWPEVAVELKAQQAALGSGCVYYERCSLAGKDKACARSRPALVEIAPDHPVSCRLSTSQQ
jgi:oligopeptide/dipeptide ABC transporter ATP-binding protein